MVLALGHTLYLVHIETATVSAHKPSNSPPDSSAQGRLVTQDRSDLHYPRCDRI